MKRIAVAVERSTAYGRNLIFGVAEVAEQHAEWDLVLIDPRNAAAKLRQSFAGCICRVADGRVKDVLARADFPVVDCLCTAPVPGFASIMTDAERIGRLAAEHLMRHRLPNFAFCGYRRVAFSDRRRNAFASALDRQGARPAIYRPAFSRDNRFGQDFLLGDRTDSPPDAPELAKWLKGLPKPVGVFCCDDLRASNVLATCRSLGIAVPREIAILGVDNDPIYCMFAAPRLSSVDPDAVAIGKAAAATLERMMSDRGAAADPPRLAVPPKGIVVRASTNTYPHAPLWFADALDFISSNVSMGISASDVFSHVGFSRTLVERTFRECLSSSVQSKIAEARIARAKLLLRTTSRPVKEIAALSGFASPEYLSRTFASATGLSPTAWRESFTL